MSEITETTIVCDDCGKEWTDGEHYTDSECFRIRKFNEYTGASSKLQYHYCYDCLPDPDPQTRWFEEGDKWQYETVEISLQKNSGLVTHLSWLILPPYRDADNSEYASYKGRDEITHTAPEDIHELVGMVEDSYWEKNSE